MKNIKTFISIEHVCKLFETILEMFYCRFAGDKANANYRKLAKVKNKK